MPAVTAWPAARAQSAPPAKLPVEQRPTLRGFRTGPPRWGVIRSAAQASNSVVLRTCTLCGLERWRSVARLASLMGWRRPLQHGTSQA